MLVDVVAFSHAGHVYQHNEDAYVLDEVNQSYVIADGMGGHNSGEVASDIAVQSYQQALLEHQPIEQRAHYCHQAILNHANEHPKYEGMGSTLLAVQLVGNAVEFTWVGDSRLYWFANGKLVRLSEDHSFVQDLIDRGILTEEEALTHQQRNLITQGLGMKKPLKPSSATFYPFHSGVLLLCSDGVSDMLSDSQISQAFKLPSLKDQANALNAAVLATEARDNFTAILVSIDVSHYAL
ncbi:PP2C family protein-serine/threonine phosphatase [Vibrio methylphosphonaticus]|uniref:PP2C family protein-serine/threonine phosphatase n=1 Tax=Vibrio methylphosphonaticus TaxID=2946866 RepID=UPI00202A0A66|nr:protein phosphatase 2C domain-containing protein [Vibrio methylphosphonaticus]MCL9777274.1 protein phosphatase 2C domain-containing protein [Vibrio methylphosphonaticus]